MLYRNFDIAVISYWTLHIGNNENNAHPEIIFKTYFYFLASLYGFLHIFPG